MSILHQTPKRAVALVTATDRMGRQIDQIQIARDYDNDLNRDINAAHAVLYGRHPDAYVFVRLGNKRVDETRAVILPTFRGGYKKVG